MARIDSRNQRLEDYTEEAEDIKASIKDIADNKQIDITSGIDTPLSLLTKIDNNTIKIPTANKVITSNGVVNVTDYASATVNVTPQYENLPVEPYVRPSDWLTMPALDNTKDDIYLLVGVGNRCQNQIRVILSGSGTIDWGDGSATETFTNTIQTEFYHYYNETDISTSTWTAHNESKQVIVHIQGNRGDIILFSLKCRYPYIDANGNTAYISNASSLYFDVYQINGDVLSSQVYVSGYESSNYVSNPVKLEIFNWSGSITNTSLSYMFYRCISLQSISTLNLTASVTDMSYMFYGCTSLQQIQDLSSYMSNVTTLNYMFSGCFSLRDISWFTLPNTNFTSLNSLFSNCRSLVKIPKLTLGSNNSLTSISNMFYGCNCLRELDLSDFNTSNVTSMSEMFNGCESLQELDLSNFNTSNVISGYSMFYNCSSLSTLDLSRFNTTKFDSFSNMFNGCKSLVKLDLSNFNTANVTNMSRMFNQCYSLQELDLSNFNTSKVTNMSYMFYQCYSLQELDLSMFNTSKVTTFNTMFYGCSNLQKLNISSFKTSTATDMTSMIWGCNRLQITDFTNLNTSNVTNMGTMFYDNRLNNNKINLDATVVTSINSMFSSCFNLTKVKLYNLNPAYSSGLTLTITNLVKMSKQDLLDLFNSLATNINNRSRTISMGTTLQGYLANTYVKDSGTLYKIILPTSDTSAQSGKQYYIYNSNTDTYTQVTPDFSTSVIYYEQKTATWNEYVFCESTDTGAMLALDYVRNVKKYTVS